MVSVSIAAVGAIIMLIVGHILRAVRQSTLLPAKARPGNFHLMVGLGLGYVINAIVPFRIGEIARALYASKRAEQNFCIVCASVIAERVSDLSVVAAILAIVALVTEQPVLLGTAAIMAVSAVTAFILSVLLLRSQWARTMLWSTISLFNDRLRLVLVDLIWTAVQLLTSTALLRPSFLMLTLLMWSAYLTAYMLVGVAVGLDVYPVIVALLSSPLYAFLATGLLSGPVVLMTSVATLMILAAGLIADGVGVRDAVRNVLLLGIPRKELSSLAFSGVSFDRTEDYGVMLDAHFTSRQPVMASFGLHGMGDAVVRHMLPGGSDAITAVVAIGDKLAIRKYASDAAGRKLAEQVDWLRRHEAELPLAKIAAEHRGMGIFHYDMPYISSARDFHEMAHVMSVSDGQRLLCEVVDRVADWHDTNAGPECAPDVLHMYIDRKICLNARIMLEFARQRLPERHLINGAEYRLSGWECMFDHDWISEQIPTRRTSAIHGDLTIENIIVCPDNVAGWYLIDPNPGNIFDTPLIDWAKLMQSLNLGYETLNRGPMARMGDGAVDVMLHRSRTYAELHAALQQQLTHRLGQTVMREISFHEIVNYLRLIPYKIRQNPAKAMTFFAAVSILLRRYNERVDA
jgi:hypothetical protein